jgi:hypothetical protein
VEKSQLTNNYQYYECEIDKHIKLDFTKGKQHNETVMEDWNHTYPSVSEKIRTEWYRLMVMIKLLYTGNKLQYTF